VRIGNLRSCPLPATNEIVSNFLKGIAMEKVSPALSRGLRDLLPSEMIGRQKMVDTIRGVYELYGFVPINTPAIEYLNVLGGAAGEEAQQSIFRVQGPEKEALGLRFDLTFRSPASLRNTPSCPSRSGATRSRQSGGLTSRVPAGSASLPSSISIPSVWFPKLPTPRSSPACATRSMP
jgi:hypothetical protein